MLPFKIYRTLTYYPPVEYGSYTNAGFQMFIEPNTAITLDTTAPTTLLWGLNFEKYNVVTASANNDNPYFFKLVNDGITSTGMVTFPLADQTITTGDTYIDLLTDNPYSIICMKNLNVGSRYSWMNQDANDDIVASDLTFTYDYTLSSMTAVAKHFVLKYENDVSNSTYTERTTTTGALPAVTVSTNRLTAVANGAILNPQTGVPMSAEQNILVKDQADAKQNGVYSVFVAGTVSTPFILVRVGLESGESFIPNDQYKFITDAGSQAYSISSTGVVDTNNMSFTARATIDFDTSASVLYPFSITSNTFSLSIWIKKNSTVGTADDYTTFGVAKSSDIAGTYYNLGLNQLGYVTFSYASGPIAVTSTLSFSLTTSWQFIVLVASGTAVSIYSDATLMNMPTLSGLPSSPYTAVPLLQFLPSTSGVTHSYADVACWNSALSQEEINYLYMNPRLAED